MRILFFQHILPLQILLHLVILSFNPYTQNNLSPTVPCRFAACDHSCNHALWASSEPQHHAWNPASAAVRPQGHGQVASWLLSQGIHSHLQRLPLSLWILDWSNWLLRPHCWYRTCNAYYCSNNNETCKGILNFLTFTFFIIITPS